MKLLVTGASGFIAQSFIKYSLNKNIKITAISRRKNKISRKNLNVNKIAMLHKNAYKLLVS